MSMKEYQYSVDKNDIEDLITFRSTWSVCNVDFIAEEAAQDYWDNCDGWEASWPIKFYIFKERELIGSRIIGIEVEPKFVIKRRVEEGIPNLAIRREEY